MMQMMNMNATNLPILRSSSILFCRGFCYCAVVVVVYFSCLSIDGFLLKAAALLCMPAEDEDTCGLAGEFAGRRVLV